MADWQALVTSALLGTERRPLQPGADSPALLTQRAPEDDAQALLLSAAVASLQRRAGTMPPGDDTPLAAAPAETVPCCSRRAMRHLTVLLSEPNRYYALLVEWIGRIASKRQRVPHAALPALFDLATRLKPLLPLAALVGGDRGHWLAAQNPAWKQIARADAEQAWTMIRTNLPTADKKAVTDLLQPQTGQPPEIALQQFLAGRRIVSAEVVNLLLDHLLPKPGGKTTYGAVQTLEMIATSVTPELLGPATGRIRQTHATGVKGLDDVLHLFEFRAEMLRELDRD